MYILNYVKLSHTHKKRFRSLAAVQKEIKRLTHLKLECVRKDGPVKYIFYNQSIIERQHTNSQSKDEQTCFSVIGQ